MRLYLSRSVDKEIKINGRAVSVADFFGVPGLVGIAPIFDNLADLAKFQDVDGPDYFAVDVSDAEMRWGCDQ